MDKMKEVEVELDELIAKANVQCQKIKDYINKKEEMFDILDLKLHDASFYEYDRMKADFPLCFADNEPCSENSYFYMFCESAYSQFIEWCEKEGIDFDKMWHSIGRTSKFYLYEDEFIQRDAGKIRFDWTMSAIFSTLATCNLSELVIFANDGTIDKERTTLYDPNSLWTKEVWDQNIIASFSYIANEMYDDFVAKLEDIRKVYNYIKDVKDNQIEEFKEFLELFESDLARVKEEEDAEQKAREEIIQTMPENVQTIMRRYAIDSEDLAVIVSCMNTSCADKKEPAFVPHLISFFSDLIFYGNIGDTTPFKDANGESLRIGDTVTLYDRDNFERGEWVIVKEKNKSFVWSIEYACEQDGTIRDGWKIILNRRSENIPDGTVINNIRYVRE